MYLCCSAMNRGSKFLILVAMVVPLTLVVFATFKARHRIHQRSETDYRKMTNTLVAVILSWQTNIPTIPVQQFKGEDFDNSLVVDTVGVLPEEAHVELLKKTVFDLIQGYNSKTADAFLAFWEPYHWTLNKETSSYLHILAKTQQIDDPRELIRESWEKIASNNQIIQISPRVMKANISWTQNVGELVHRNFLSDIMQASSVSFPGPTAILVSRSVFDSNPLSSAIIEKDGRVLYARVTLFVKYSFVQTDSSHFTVPLVLGLYWSPTIQRWVPHLRGSTVAIDKFGIIY